MATDSDPVTQVPRGTPTDSHALALAQDLRRLSHVLVDQELSEAQLRAAHESVRGALDHLGGEPRRRWYETAEPSPFGQETSRAFDALSPVRGELNPIAPPLSVESGVRADGQPCLLGRARLSNAYEGPPRGVHGGIVAALFDEILGAALSLAPPPGVTARLEVDYHHLTPIDEDLRLEAWIHEERGRRILAHATCHAGETLTARAEALFIRVDFQEVEDRMRARSLD